MKIQKLAFICFLVVAFVSGVLYLKVSSSQDNSSQVMKFKSWIRDNRKKYIDQEQYESKFKIFVDSDRKIRQHNRYFERGLSGFKMGLSKFSDMEIEQFSKEFLDMYNQTQQLKQLRDLCYVEVLGQQVQEKTQFNNPRHLQQSFSLQKSSEQNRTKLVDNKQKINKLITPEHAESDNKQTQLKEKVKVKTKIKSKNEIDLKFVGLKPKRHTSVDALLTAIDYLHQNYAQTSNNKTLKDMIVSKDSSLIFDQKHQRQAQAINAGKISAKVQLLRQKQQKQEMKKDLIKLFSLKTVSDDKIQQSKDYLQSLSENYGLLMKRGTSLIESSLKQNENGQIKTEKLPNSISHQKQSKSQVKIQGCKIIQIPQHSNTNIQNALEIIVVKNPILITLKLNQQLKNVLRFYKQGIVNLTPNGKPEQIPNFLQSQRLNFKSLEQNKAIENSITFAIVGYSNQQSQSYWRVKSVWNKGWGQNGQFKIRKNRDLRQFKNAILSYPIF